MNGSMKTQTKLQARAILLEQFNNGVNNAQVALKAVLRELGPKSMSKKSAIFWYKRYRKSDFSLGKGASKADQKLIDRSTFLSMKRALFCVTFIESYSYNFLDVTGANGRFQFFSTESYSDRSYWVLDTYHGRRNRLIFDASELRYQSSTTLLQISEVGLEMIHFIDYEKCVIIFGRWQSYIVAASFQITTCTMKLGECRQISMSSSNSFFADTQSVGLLERNTTTNTTQYTTIDFKADGMKFENRVDLGPTLWLKCAARQGGIVIGFNDGDWTTDFKSLVTISLTDGRVSTRPTNLSEELNNALNCQKKMSFVWIKEKLFTYASSHDSMSTIYVFDLGTLEWKNTGIQLPGLIEHMSSADDNVLIINVTKSCRSKWKEIYRFPIFGPDSLLNLSWMKARRRAQFEPEYNNQSLQKLPTYCHVYLGLLIASLVSDIKLPVSEYAIHVRLEVLRPVDHLNNFLLWESYHRRISDSGAVKFKKRWQRYIKCYRPCLTAKRLLIYPTIDGRSAILTYKTEVNKTGDMQFIHQLSSYPPNSRYEPQTPFRTNHTDCFIDEGIHNCAHDTTQTGQLDFIEGNKEADARLRVRYNDPSDLEYFGFDQCALTKQYKKNDVYQVVPLYQTILMPSDRPTPNFCFQMYGTLQTQFYTLDQVRAMINSSAFKQVDPSIDPSKFNFTVGVQFIATRANASLGSRVFQLTDEMKRVFMPEVLRQFVYVIVGLFLVVVILDVTLLLMLLVIRSIGRRQKPTTATSVVYRYIPVLFNPRTDGHPVNFQPDDTEAPHTSELPPTCADDVSTMKTVQLTATKTKLVGVKEPSASASTTRRRFGQKVSSNEKISGPETSLGRNEIAKSSAEPLNETKPTNQSAEPTADRSLSLRSKPPVEYSAKE